MKTKLFSALLCAAAAYGHAALPVTPDGEWFDDSIDIGGVTHVMHWRSTPGQHVEVKIWGNPNYLLLTAGADISGTGQGVSWTGTAHAVGVPSGSGVYETAYKYYAYQGANTDYTASERPVSLWHDAWEATIHVIQLHWHWSGVTELASKTLDTGRPTGGLLMLDKETAYAPATVELSWMSVGRTAKVTGPNGVIGTDMSGKTTLVDLPVGSYTYELEVNGGGGPKNASVTKRTVTLAVLPNNPTVTLTVQARAVPKPGMETWLEPSPVVTRTFTVNTVSP